jgi:hypothetical protein
MGVNLLCSRIEKILNVNVSLKYVPVHILNIYITSNIILYYIQCDQSLGILF